ncbi:MAG TPA: hypothetical protein VJ044_13285 [Candidatus Hodarchaeales archaeon]|nr:hypothetical protein [Candidatus Hodarchaeales archaeon]
MGKSHYCIDFTYRRHYTASLRRLSTTSVLVTIKAATIAHISKFIVEVIILTDSEVGFAEIEIDVVVVVEGEVVVVELLLFWAGAPNIVKLSKYPYVDASV